MTQTLQADITIVGAGIVGASMAARLSQDPNFAHTRIVLVDAVNESPALDLSQFDARVVALSGRSQSFLQQAGIWSFVQQTRVCPYQKMQVWDADGTASISFNSADVHQSELGHICENRVLLAGADRVLAQRAGINRLRGANLVDIEVRSAECVRLRLDDGKCIDTRLLLAADGARSKIRELAGFTCRNWDYGHTAIVTTVSLEKSHDFCAWQRFSSEGPLAFLPLSRDGQESHQASIVWSVRTELAQSLMALNNEGFCARLTQVSEACLGKIIECDKRYAIALEQRHAERYIQPNIALLGDAAHTIHPLAGQGVNLGLYDVETLYAELSRALERKVPFEDASILRRYERKRRPHNLAAMAAMEIFKRGFGSDDIALRWLRNLALNTADNSVMLKKLFSLAATGNRGGAFINV